MFTKATKNDTLNLFYSARSSWELWAEDIFCMEMINRHAETLQNDGRQ